MHQFSQYDLHRQTRRKIEKMSYFVVFAYMKSWFQSPSLVGAANNDLLLYKELQKFKKIHPKTSAATSKVIRRHTWYNSLRNLSHLPSSTSPCRRRRERSLPARSVNSLSLWTSRSGSLPSLSSP